MLGQLSIRRPSLDDALHLRALTVADRRTLRPGWPLRRFVNISTGATITTRDGDIYSAIADWSERPFDLRPSVPPPRCTP